MRLLLALLFFLHVALSVAFFVPSGAASAGKAAGDVVGESIAGESVAGKSYTGTGEEGITSDDDALGKLFNTPDKGTTPSDGTGSSGDNTGNEGLHKAAEVIEKIHDVLEQIESIVSLATSTSDSTTYTITLRSPLPTAAHPCLSVESIYSACEQVYHTPNFSSQTMGQQASCLCYRGYHGSGNTTAAAMTSWVPEYFDGFVSQCNAFVASQTVVSVSATVTGAGASVGATGICASVGDVRAGVVKSASPTGQATMTTTSPTNTVPAFAGGAVGRRNGMGLGYTGMLFVIGFIMG